MNPLTSTIRTVAFIADGVIVVLIVGAVVGWVL